MQILLVLASLAADTSGRREPVPKSEDLGASWTAGVVSEDRGLSVQEFYNRTLERLESWHLSPGQEWFLKVRRGVEWKRIEFPTPSPAPRTPDR
jgi:hypothetical protein